MGKNLIHTRTVIVEVYDQGDGTISIEGSLEDRQPLDSGYFQIKRRDNDPRPPGVLHGMSSSFKVDRQTGQILKVGGTFEGRPYEGCAAVIGWLPKLEGLEIRRGYNSKSKELLGGPKGCAHMNTLLQVMSNTKNAAGAYYLGPRSHKADQDRKQLGESYVHPAVDTCHMWRSDGPLMEAVREGKDAVKQDL